MADLIDRDRLKNAMAKLVPWAIDHDYTTAYTDGLTDAYNLLCQQPSALPERLTDKEQRIFLAAMGREEKVCKEVDAEMTREPYEDSLVRVCHEITRKVKKALWTN